MIAANVETASRTTQAKAPTSALPAFASSGGVEQSTTFAAAFATSAKAIHTQATHGTQARVSGQGGSASAAAKQVLLAPMVGKVGVEDEPATEAVEVPQPVEEKIAGENLSLGDEGAKLIPLARVLTDALGVGKGKLSFDAKGAAKNSTSVGESGGAKASSGSAKKGSATASEADGSSSVVASPQMASVQSIAVAMPMVIVVSPQSLPPKTLKGDAAIAGAKGASAAKVGAGGAVSSAAGAGKSETEHGGVLSTEDAAKPEPRKGASAGGVLPAVGNDVANGPRAVVAADVSAANGLGMHGGGSVTAMGEPLRQSQESAAVNTPMHHVHGSEESVVTAMESSKPNQIEVGVRGGEFGWVKVRAEMAPNGEVHAFLRAATSESTQALTAQASTIQSFLGAQDVTVKSVHVETMQAGMGAGGEAPQQRDTPSGQSDGARVLRDRRDESGVDAVKDISSGSVLAGISRRSNAGTGNWLNVRA